MAYITLNNKFTPYTFEELVKPFVMYDTAYQQAQAKTDELLEKAALLEDLSPTLDKEAYDSYQDWKGQLRAISDQIAETGLDINTRRAITSLGNTYRTDYLPYTEKLKTRGALIKEQREYLQKHPNAFFNIDYSTTPVTDITASSTYNAYDPEDIFKKVAEHSYSRLASGQPDLTDEEYLSQFGEGISDETQRGRVAQAIQSGKALAAANKQQRDLENYLRELQVKKSYARSSGGGGSYSYPGGGTGTIPIALPDGTEIFMTYDKKLGKYKYQDKDKNWHTSEKPSGEEAIDEAITTYYGGQYGKITVNGKPVRRIKSSDGSYYAVMGPNHKWIELENGPATTVRDYFAKTGREVILPTPQELSRGDVANFKKRVGKNIEEKEVTLSELADYQNGVTKAIAEKLTKLRDSNLLQDAGLTLYIDKNTQQIAGYTANPRYTVANWNAPIEDMYD